MLLCFHHLENEKEREKFNIFFKDVVHTYNVVYSPTERNETGSLVEMRVDLDPVTQSEVSQKEKQISCINAYVWNLEN